MTKVKLPLRHRSNILVLSLCRYLLNIFFSFSARVISLISSFGSSWRQALDAVNREVMSSFPSFRTGAAVLQQALTLLVQYYHRFQKIIGEVLPHLTARQDLVNIHQLMVEVKKYKPNF